MGLDLNLKAREVGCRRGSDARAFVVRPPSPSPSVSLALVSSCGGNEGKTGVSLIIKTQTNPYFVSMKKAAQAEAKRTDTHLSVAAGNADGDTQSQINAIDTAIARGDKGILITSNGPAVNAALRQAKEYGLFVIALDTPLDPVDTADVTYATNNFKAGQLIGQYAAERLAGKKAVIAMLDLYDDQVVSVDIDRDHGFLTGMGIDPGSKTLNAKEKRSGSYTGGKGGSYEIACHQATQGAVDGGRKAMEQCLSPQPRHQRRLHDQRAGGRGRPRRARRRTTATTRRSSSRSTAAARAWRTSRTASSRRTRRSTRARWRSSGSTRWPRSARASRPRHCPRARTTSTPAPTS